MTSSSGIPARAVCGKTIDCQRVLGEELPWRCSCDWTELMSRSHVRPRVYMTFALFAALAAYQPAKGQESLQLPSLELPKSGIAEGIPNDVMPSDTPNADALSSPLIGRALASFFKDSVQR